MTIKRSWIVLLALVALGAAAGYHYRSALRLYLLMARGRVSLCGAAEARRAEQNARYQAGLTAVMKKVVRRAKQEGTLDLWKTPRGTFWIPTRTAWFLPEMLAEQSRRLYRPLQEGDVVLDCGAHVGVFTREALHQGARLVVAIEPAPENLVCLRRNFESEIAAGRVIVADAGVWDKEETLPLRVQDENSAADSVALRYNPSREGPQVRLTTIDRLAGELKLDRVDFIKMDIEGAEQQALAGARETLARFHPRLAISDYHRPEDPAKIPGVVKRAWSGYQMECGFCMEHAGRIAPEILYFR